MMLPKDKQKSAEALMEKGAERTLKKDDLLLSQAEWLLGIGERDKALSILREAMTRNPRLVTSVIPMMQAFSLSKDEVAIALPPYVGVWLHCAAYFEQSAWNADGTFFYDHAFSLLQTPGKLDPDWFLQLYTFYLKRKENDKALSILRLGSTKIPEYTPFHIWLGDYYAREGISYRAVEEYQQALLLQPKNISIQQKIDQLNGSASQR